MKSISLFAALLLCSFAWNPLHADPPAMSPSTQTVTVTVPGTIAWPNGGALLQTFTSGNRSTTAPWNTATLGFQTDTNTFWSATGISAGNWQLISMGSAGIGGDVSAAPAGSVLVSNGSGNNAMATGVTINGSNQMGIGISPATTLHIGGPNSGLALTNSAAGVTWAFGNSADNHFTIFSGTSTSPFNSPLIDFNVSSGFVGIGTITPSAQLSVQASDSATNTVVNALTLTHATSATAAPGLGVGQVFQLPSDAGTSRMAGHISTAWTSATDGAESSTVSIQPMGSGSQTAGLVVGPTSLTFNGTAVGGGGGALVRGSGTLQGWTSYTAATAATTTAAVLPLSDDGTLYEVSLAIDGASAVTFSFSASGDPEDGSTYLGAPNGALDVDSATLAAAWNGQAGCTAVASEDGTGNITVTSSTMGTSSSVAINGAGGSAVTSTGTVTGSAAVGPSGQVGSVTLLSGTTGKTNRAVSVYAVGYGQTAWNGTLNIAYGDGTSIFNQSLTTTSGAVLIPAASSAMTLNNLTNGVISQSITATFTSSGSDDLDNFSGGALQILIICDQQ